MNASLSDIIIFDRNRIQHNRNRCRSNFIDFNFLFNWTSEALSDRLYDINRSFDMALQIGSRSTFLNHKKINCIANLDLSNHPILPQPLYIQATEELLPIKPQSLDLVISTLNLHSVNDLPGTLLQIQQSLKPDGLFLAAIFGGETLHELRHSMTQAEINLFGGISPHISPFADKPQMGDLLQRAGFALPVIDSEIIKVTYPSLTKLLYDLRGMGEGNAILARQKSFSQKSFFAQTQHLYQENYCNNEGLFTASFEIIFLLGWSPHASQQKPLKPGTAKISLAEALGTS